ncbi:MAG TPA: hypothetical protein PKD78_02090, partial [Saprospiraceae bacterium]|nr:hypothetical protein [Saprospiraceae bacterium]
MIDAFSRVREVNLAPPLAGKIIQDISTTPDFTNLFGLFSVYYACDSVVTYTTGTTVLSNIPKMAEVNFETGAVTPIPCAFPQGATITGATTPLEFLGSVPCPREFDLDADNSTGATGSDYASPPDICPHDSIALADADLKLLYHKPIDSVQVHFLPGGALPDGAQEQLFVNTLLTAPGLMVTGNGTGWLTLSAQQPAADSVFRKALTTAIYHNSAVLPTPGLRSIRFIPWSAGKMVDTAMAFIQLPSTPSSSLTLHACPGGSA